MDTLRPESVRAAAAILDAVHAGTPDLPTTFEAIAAGLHRTLGPWIGRDGCSRLLHRAMLLAARRHPALRGVTVQETAPHLAGLSRIVESLPAVARLAVEAFLALPLQDLGALVGDGIALRIVLPDSPTLWSVAEPTHGEER